MAFWLFLGFIPLVAILGWALASFSGPQFRQSMIGSLATVTPEPALKLLDEQMQRLQNHTEAVAPLSVLGFLWVASGGVHTAIGVIQRAQAGRERSWVYNRILALAFVIALVAAATSSTALWVAASPTWLGIIKGGPVEVGWWQFVQYGALPTSTMVAILGCAVFYRLSSMKTDRTIRKRVWPGAVMTGLSWIAVSWGFSVYVRTMGRYPIFYGSLAAVALLMLWLWIICFLLLLGSEVNLQVEGSRQTIAPSRPDWMNHLHIPKLRRLRTRGLAPDPMEKTLSSHEDR